MEELTYSAKTAILRMLLEIQHADKRVHEKEVEYIEEVRVSFHLPPSYVEDVEKMTTPQALAEISHLSASEKEKVAKMMGRMIVCDKDINYDEVRLYNAFCQECGIEYPFDIDDYTDVTLSGAFDDFGEND